MSNTAAVRGQLAQQQLQQRCLAGTVGADDAQAITALDQTGKVLDENLSILLEAQVFGLDDPSTRGGSGLDVQPAAPLLLAALGPLATHRLQGPHPAFVEIGRASCRERV